MNEEERKKIEKADEKELQSLAEWWCPDSGHGHLAKVRLDKLRHEALLPKPWYRTGLGWIAFLTLLVAIVGAALAALALYK
jgi:hypothetical protein